MCGGQGQLSVYGSGWSVFLKDQRVHFTINQNDLDDGKEVELIHPTSIAISEIGNEFWYHVGAEYTGERALLYVDGETVESTLSGRIVYRENESLTFGQFAAQGSETDYFDVRLDEVKIYPVGLQQQETDISLYQMY